MTKQKIIQRLRNNVQSEIDLLMEMNDLSKNNRILETYENMSELTEAIMHKLEDSEISDCFDEDGILNLLKIDDRIDEQANTIKIQKLQKLDKILETL